MEYGGQEGATSSEQNFLGGAGQRPASAQHLWSVAATPEISFACEERSALLQQQSDMEEGQHSSRVPVLAAVLGLVGGLVLCVCGLLVYALWQPVSGTRGFTQDADRRMFLTLASSRDTEESEFAGFVTAFGPGSSVDIARRFGSSSTAERVDIPPSPTSTRTSTQKVTPASSTNTSTAPVQRFWMHNGVTVDMQAQSTTTKTSTTEVQDVLSSSLSMAEVVGGAGDMEGNEASENGASMQPGAGSNCGEEAREFYLYRAQSDKNYAEQNVNAADLAGVLWYLHNEVVTMCPRKYDITRILRLKVTMLPSEALRAEKKFFAPYVAFDSGKCTVPGCEATWLDTGFNIGCQRAMAGAMGGYDGQWFSLPGPCPQEEYGSKTGECVAAWPGGACAAVTGGITCTYNVMMAGEIRVDDLMGVSDYARFCRDGGLEYDKATDTGVNLTFWTGIDDKERCQSRVRRLRDMFREQYSDSPQIPDGSCADEFDSDCGEARPIGS